MKIKGNRGIQGFLTSKKVFIMIIKMWGNCFCGIILLEELG